MTAALVLVAPVTMGSVRQDFVTARWVIVNIVEKMIPGKSSCPTQFINKKTV